MESQARTSGDSSYRLSKDDCLGGVDSSSHLVIFLRGLVRESSLNVVFLFLFFFFFFFHRRGQTAEQPASSAFRGVVASDKSRKGGYFPMRES